jgi:hypothetical protein
MSLLADVQRTIRHHIELLELEALGRTQPNCELCGRPFVPRRRSARYCSTAHRVAAFRGRRQMAPGGPQDAQEDADGAADARSSR